MRLPKRKLVRVHLKTGRTIEGVLTCTRGDWLAVAKARVEVDGQLVESDGAPELIPRDNIDWVTVR